MCKGDVAGPGKKGSDWPLLGSDPFSNEDAILQLPPVWGEASLIQP